MSRHFREKISIEELWKYDDRQSIPRRDRLKAGECYRYIVEACGFTFEFNDLDEIEYYVNYFSQKIIGSNAEHIGSADHWEVQSSTMRLPQWLKDEKKRPTVHKALLKALNEFKGMANGL
ncbi:MAG: hypothetical protein HRU15_07375 [Planctomycetes bacterium]|nr:hypothetical protein [Planctomycetota bacterium]